MRIVHVEDYFDPSAGYQINELLLASRNFKDEVFLITSKDMTPFHKNVNFDSDRKFEKENNVKIIRLDSAFRLSSRLVLKGLWKTLSNLHPDLVFMHGIGDFKDLILFQKKKDFVIIRDCHMSWVASKNRFRRLYYRAFRTIFSKKINSCNKYNVVYALGKEEYQYLKHIGISDSKIDYLPHGYNKSIMFYDEIGRNDVRNQYSILPDDILISYIGKFNTYKRPDLVFDIVKNLDENIIDIKKVKLLFIGPKDDKYMVEFDKKKLDLSYKYTIIVDDSKSYSDLRKYYSASDICIFPKETSLSSIHAQICGCPVIMEDHVSNIERVVKKDNLFEVNNLNQATDILMRIIERREYLKNNATSKLFNDREYKNQVEKLRKLI